MLWKSTCSHPPWLVVYFISWIFLFSVSSYCFVRPLFKPFHTHRAVLTSHTAGWQAGVRGGGGGSNVKSLRGDKEVVLLHLSQCKHHSPSTLMHKHTASGWVLIRKHGWAPSEGPYHNPFMNTHVHTHTHSWCHYKCLWSEWQPFISVCLHAKWLSSMHPTIRKCQKHTRIYKQRARTHINTHFLFLQEMRSN